MFILIWTKFRPKVKQRFRFYVFITTLKGGIKVCANKTLSKWQSSFKKVHKQVLRKFDWNLEQEAWVQCMRGLTSV